MATDGIFEGRARAALLLLIVVLPVGKWLQLEFSPGEDHVRQAVLVAIALLAVVSVVPVSRVSEAVLGWHVALPRRARSEMWKDWRWARLLLGILIVAADVALGIAVLNERSRGDLAALAVLVLLLAAVLALWEGVRAARARAARDRPAPDRAVLWTVIPVSLLWALPLLVASAIGHELDPTLGVTGDSCSVGP
ncbi:MAG: hypothetical protein M3144_08620, partial [Actinomycetota bacterium]|nr:hypothetical protein [Actinomycetota bacterium]